VRRVVVETGKRLDEVGHGLATLLTRLFTSRDLQESKARLEEAQRVAHVGYWIWNLDSDRVTWSDETYRIFGLKLISRISTAIKCRFMAIRFVIHKAVVTSVTAFFVPQGLL
jgi:PAS domain-containing protein